MRKENQMRRIGMIIQAVLILILSSCYRGEGGTFGYGSDGEGGVIIKNAIVTGDSLVIPSEINGKPVTGIGYECFFKEAGIKSIVIPGSVKVIGVRAFGSCTSVESLTIEDGVEKIESWAFQDLAIKELVIPGSVSEIEENAFSLCENLEKITILPGKLKEFPLAFTSSTFKEVILPENIESVNLSWSSDARVVYNPVNIRAPLFSESIRSDGPVVVDPRYPFAYTGRLYHSDEVYLQWEHKNPWDLYERTVENVFFDPLQTSLMPGEVPYEDFLEYGGGSASTDIYRDNLTYFQYAIEQANSPQRRFYLQLAETGAPLTFYVPNETAKIAMENRRNKILQFTPEQARALCGDTDLDFAKALNFRVVVRKYGE